MDNEQETVGEITPSRTITNSSVAKSDHYVPTWNNTRPGSQAHEDVPSLRADGRYYRDGRVEAA